jgi:peroxiredoxin
MRVIAGIFLLGLVLAAIFAEEDFAPSSNSPDAHFRAGDPAPDIEVMTLTGEPKKLSDFRGKVVLLNFWATWCVPCVTEMPSLERLYQLYRSKGLEVVALNFDMPRDFAAVKKFVAEQGLTMHVLQDPKMLALNSYRVSGFPETFFIDRNGKIAAIFDSEKKTDSVRVMSERAWDSKAYTAAIEKLLGQPQ